MKIIATTMLAAITLVGGNLYAEEELPEAPAAVLKSIKANCHEYAEEDDIKAEDLKEYLLKCINEELSDLDYRAVSSI
jgi:hypothetical protein